MNAYTKKYRLKIKLLKFTDVLVYKDTRQVIITKPVCNKAMHIKVDKKYYSNNNKKDQSTNFKIQVVKKPNQDYTL